VGLEKPRQDITGTTERADRRRRLEMIIMKLFKKGWIAVFFCWGFIFGAVVQGQQADSTCVFQDPRDGQSYKWVRIGEQVWMAENLRYATDTGSWCWENDESTVADRGRLYNWETAMQVAMPGWHLPSDDEWKILERHLGLTDDQIEETGLERGGDSNTIGMQLKKRGAWATEYDGQEIVITNESGFSAVPTGLYSNGIFSHDGYTGWWSSTPDGDKAWIRFLGFFANKMWRDMNKKVFAYPVRVVED